MEDVFVFGSNLRGNHGAGAALCALNHHGAVLGKGVGLHGNSYAIPTKDRNLKTLPLSEISKHVKKFLEFAKASTRTRRFYVTRIGCGLAGYKPEDIAPMFSGAPENCILPVDFEKIIKDVPAIMREPGDEG